MIKPSMDEARLLSKNYNMIPIMLEIFADVKTSIETLKAIRAKSKCCYILESVNDGNSWGRYSFLGYDPVMSINGTNGIITVKDGSGKKTELGDAIGLIRETLTKYKSPRISYMPPFTGGFVGYLSYDFVRNFIPGLVLNAKNNGKFQDFNLMLMDRVIAFDHFKQKIYLIVNVSADDLETSYVEGVIKLKDMEKIILDENPPAKERLPVCGKFSPAFTPEEFTEMVEKVKGHIKEGDIFQAVISNRFTAPFNGSLLETYRTLRTTNPSPYMVYMRTDDMEIACASPETLVSLQDGEVNSFPLAGTCPRGKTDEEDKALTAALLSDEKELAEHDMLVDLARNDVGKISEFKTVQVKEYRQIKRFSHVSHISSRVSGKLAEGLDAIDVIAAALPAGTLSGAPKKRACEIIDAVEGMKRGVYGGAIGYIDFAGNMDMCIGIRMAVLKDGNVFVQSGAGIVADSVAEKEYHETRHKARAVMEALTNSGEV